MKPDGWHVYHICGGQVRTINAVSNRGRFTELMCVYCGEWAEVLVKTENDLRVEGEQRRSEDQAARRTR